MKFQLIKGLILVSVLLILVSSALYSQSGSNAHQINQRLGRGINMGNAFEAPSETAWGNPWRPEYFRIIAELGFDHVRVPIRWEPSDRSRRTAPYTITPVFLNRIKDVVDTALQNNLMVIINMHHHEALLEDPLGQKERFLSQWRQIADFFKDYPEELLFEVLNEPHQNLTPALWNVFFSEALGEIRKTNPTRTVLLGCAEFGGLAGIPHLDPPDDKYIILTPHFYSPFTFTHQGAEWTGSQSQQWLGTRWLDTEAERESLQNEFSVLFDFLQKHDIPVHIGEFGAYSRADMESRIRWTRFLARWFEEQGFSWAYWEFSAGFGIYNPRNRTFNQGLVDALLHDPMPAARPIAASILYQSDFSRMTDGWRLNFQGGATGIQRVSNGKLEVNIELGGSEGWHAQLVKGGLTLEKDTMYRLGFRARALSPMAATVYVGRSTSPWTSYSGYSALSFTEREQEYSISFTSPAADNAARIVFDLGRQQGQVKLDNIQLEKINIAE